MKFKLLLSLSLLSALLLGACEEGISVDEFETVQASKEDSEVTEKEFYSEISVLVGEIQSFFKELNPLIEMSSTFSEGKLANLKSEIEESIVNIKTLEFSPKTKSENLIYDQALVLIHYFENMQKYALKYTTSGESVQLDLYLDYKEDVKTEFDILGKMLSSI